MVAADDRTAVTFSLSPGQAGDAPEGRNLLKTLENCGWEGACLIMDNVHEGEDTHQLILDLGMTTGVPQKINRVTPWEYDKEMYKKRNEEGRLFRLLKGFRR